MSSLDFEPGSTVSHFRLEKKLGEGGMGAVYLAEDLTLSRRVAIKFMSRSLVAKQAKPEVREALEVRFIREAKSAAAINHPNVCQIYEADFETDDWYIAMEYIKGKDLVDILEESGTFSPSTVADVCRQVASGLKYAWNHYKIVHRDIKPRNIMVTDEGMAKIVDLGLAKPITEAEEENDMPDVTMAGTAIGTPQYMAPEQATGDTNIDFMVDIYALGASLYEMCTGKKAFNEKTPTMIYMSQMGKKYKPIREFRTDIPDALIQLIDDMLEPSREDRIGSYDEILDRVRKMSKSTQSVFEDDEDFSDLTMGVTQIAESRFKDYPEDAMLLDRYRVMKKIGHSRAGVVYKCIDNTDGGECAVKSLAPEREFSAKSLLAVYENFKKLSEFKDPNLVEIYDVQRDVKTGEVFVVMERMEGINLREYTHQLYSESSTLGMKSIIPVLRKVAKAIDHLNDRLGFPHNDLKPESIYITNEETNVKLLDYGITARPLSANTTLLNANDYKVPLESTDYMAPEKWEHGAVSKQADQYAFALVVYEILSRRLPFWVNNPENDPDTTTKSPTKLERARYEKMKKQVLEEAIPAVAGVDKGVNAVLLTALRKHPEERFPNCVTFISRLGRAAGVREKSTVLPLLAGAAILVIGTIAFFGYQHFKKIEDCKLLSRDYTVMQQAVKSRLSNNAMASILSTANDLKKTADEEFEGRDLGAALTSYQKAMDALETAKLDLKAEESRLEDQDSKYKRDFEVRLDSFLDKMLAEDLFKSELGIIESEMKKIEAISNLDKKASAWPPLFSLLDGYEKLYGERFQDKAKETSKLKDKCDELIGAIRADALVKQAPDASKLRNKMDSLYTEVLDLHNNEANKLVVIEKWVGLEKQLTDTLLTLNKLRETYKKQALDAQREYDGTLVGLKKRYGELIPNQFDKAETYNERAEELTVAGDSYSANLDWIKAVEELDAVEIALKGRVKQLEDRRDELKNQWLVKANAIRKNEEVDGRKFLTEVNRLKKLAESKKTTPELADCVALWEKVSEELSNAQRQHSIAIKTFRQEEEDARLTRQKDIKRISITYPGEYDRIKTHQRAIGLLQNLPDPKKLLSSVTQDADDMETWKDLTEAERVLGVARKELEKRIAAHLEEQRKNALAMREDYTQRTEKVLAYPYAGDLIKPAEEHAKLARDAMSAKKFEIAIFSWKEAQASLTIAEAQLAELKKNEALRKAAMEKHLKTKLKTHEVEFDKGIDSISKSEFSATIINKPIALAEKAIAISKTGSVEDALKAWEAAQLALKEVEAEVAVLEKAKLEKEAAMARKSEREAYHAQQTFVKKRENLAESPFAKSRLADADKRAAKAKKSLENKDTVLASKLWKEAVNMLEDLEVDLRADLKTQAERLRDEVLGQRKVVSQWEKWDPTIGEKLVTYDVSMAMGRSRMDQLDFMEAGQQLSKCKEILTEIETFVKDKFIAKPGKDLIIAEVGMELRWIEKLGIWVGCYEVTNEQYRKFKPTHSSQKHEGLTLNGEKQPTCRITYYDTLAYCTWLTNTTSLKKVLPDGYKFRLPTKKEWIVFASCGQEGNVFPWGDKWPPPNGNFANREMFSKKWNLDGYSDDFPVTCDVEKSGKNGWSLYGVSGNVWEWTSDKYKGRFAVYGGAWSSTHKSLLKIDLKNENYADPQEDYDNIGFRIILEPVK